MSVESDVLEVLRSRLEAGMTDATVFLGKMIDIQEDPLPALTVVVSEPFVVRDEQIREKLRWRGMFDIQADKKVDSEDPLPELMDYGNQIIRAIYTPEDPTMGKIVNEHRPVRLHPLVPEPGSSLGSVLVSIQVDYSEDYSNV